MSWQNNQSWVSLGKGEVQTRGMGRLSLLFCGLSFVLYPTLRMLQGLQYRSESASVVERLLVSFLKQTARRATGAPLGWLWVSGLLGITPALSLLVLAILAMSSRRRSQTFLQDKVSRGAEFVKTLRLFYPQADTLCEKDFDWLFDCPETEQFITWFCKTVGEENVLSPAEVQAYDALVAAGKPILEGDALEQVLQKCQNTPQLKRVIPEAEGSSLEALEQEIQELKGCCAQQLWRLSTLQVCAASLQQELRYLEEEEKATKEVLRKAHVELRVEIFRTTTVLKQLTELAKQQVEEYEKARKGQPPALLHEMDLRGYIELEQQFTDAFERLMEQVLPGSAQTPESRVQKRLEAAIQVDSASETVGGRRAAPRPECPETGRGVAAESQGIKIQGSRAEPPADGRSEELSVGDVEEKGDSPDATERMDIKQKGLKSLRTNGDETLGKQDNFWMELVQLETAYICAQMEVIAMSAKVEGNCAALNWAQKTLEALKENKVGLVLLSNPILCSMVCLCWGTTNVPRGRGQAGQCQQCA